ncbi:MFS transporter [Microcoleus sp. MON1_C5]|uniref:MFS transporter n=1 Tax=Microcoleus sp. MON1_C5 TaxID=2818828 RepID=UPI002FD11B2A
MEKKHNAGLWVSVLYFAQGLPYTVVNLMSVIFLLDMGASNQLIGLTSLLYLPWVLKGLWGPVVDLYSTKRKWILTTEIICAFLFAFLAFGVLTPQAIVISLVIFTAIAFVSATHDIAIDGFYLNTLNKEQQALFVGVRNTAYRGAVIAGSGVLVVLAGKLAEEHLVTGNGGDTKTYQNIPLSLFGSDFSVSALNYGWATAFGICAIMFVVIYLFQRWYLPYSRNYAIEADAPQQTTSFLEAFKTYFQQYKIGWIVTYVLIFRLGDAFNLKMVPSFLKAQVEQGGLAVSTLEMGLLSGVYGVIFGLIGGLLGGYLIAKQGLRKWMWPTAILQNSTNVLYWLLAINQPAIKWAYVVNSIEQFTYGLGVAAYTVFLMRTVRPEYAASHYAITTGFMAAGVLIPGVVGGFLQPYLGYPNYFLMSSLAVIPGMLTIFFLPLEDEKKLASMPRPGLDDFD